MKIKVVLADDHPVVREGLKFVIRKKSENIEIIGEASNGYEVLEISRERPADVYILDISMPFMNGIETAQRLVKMHPRCKFIFLSFHDSRLIVEKALKMGANGYLIKDSAAEEVIDAIREVYKGGFFLSPAISKLVNSEFFGKSKLPGKKETRVHLSSRETEILQLVAEGFSSKDISEKLKISIHTVNVHRKNLMSKLDRKTQADLIRYAIKEGIAKL